jgi:hypothetical protein
MQPLCGGRFERTRDNSSTYPPTKSAAPVYYIKDTSLQTLGNICVRVHVRVSVYSPAGSSLNVLAG